jgi:hypothetical protein
MKVLQSSRVPMNCCRSILPLLVVVLALGACTESTAAIDGGNGGSTGTTGGSPDSGPPPDAGPAGNAGPPAHLGDPCDPHAATDTCNGYGLICDAANATCRWPVEFESCSLQTGCADGSLRCVSYQGGSGATYQLCFHPCATTDDCPTIFSGCRTSGALQGYCDAVRCGPAIDAGTLFGPCDFGASGVGTCIPVPSPGLGFCLASGSVAQGGPCSMKRVAAGAAALCDPQSTCVGIDPLGTFCEPLCSPMTSIAGPMCVAGGVCFPIGNALDLGACFQSCAATGTCPPGATCSNFQSGDTQGLVCLP